VSFNNPVIQQKLQFTDRKDQHLLFKSDAINENKIKSITREIIKTNQCFDFKNYIMLVEKMSKKFEESFIRQRQRFLIVEDAESNSLDLNNITVIETNQNNINQVINL